jgi:hypothetical protein
MYRKASGPVRLARNILAALKRHIESTKAGDVLVIYWAGHGQRVADYNGDNAWVLLPCLG